MDQGNVGLSSDSGHRSGDRLIVIDPRVSDYRAWLQLHSLDLSFADVMVLDDAQDGLQQIAHYLLETGRTYDALDVVSHGNMGTLYLGSTVLDQTNLYDYSDVLSEISRGLTSDGDILVYGCDVAKGELGIQFVTGLANLTGADVAASEDTTGIGGDSDLEFSLGIVERQVLDGVALLQGLLGESEPNGSLANANQIASGASVTGQIASSSDVDFYKFTASGAGSLTVALDVPTNYSSSYFTLGVYDANGTNIGLYSTGQDKTYTLGLPAAGTYYVGLSGYNSYSYNTDQYSFTATYASGSANGFESEDNGTLATADAITSGTAIKGQLSTSQDKDYFKYTATDTGVLNVIFDAPTNSTYTDYFNVSVFDVNGILLANQSSGTDLSFQAAIPTTGVYFVSVTSNQWYHDSDQYSLTLTSTAGGDAGYEQEPNDDFANALISGSTKRGQVATSDDIDWFYLNTNSSGALSINFDAPTNSTYTDYFHIWVFDREGSLLASKSTGQDINFSANAPEAGNYFVAITATDEYHDSGQYALTVTNQASAINRESESNNSNALADPLTLGTNIYGQLANSADQDHYVVSLASSGKISLGFDGPTNSSYTNYFNVNVYDSSGTLLTSRSTGSDIAFDVTAATAGSYYISIVPDMYYFDDGEYRLSVNAVLDDPIPDGAIIGTTLGDGLTGTQTDDLIYGLGGNDLIDGDAGVDTVVYRMTLANLSINTIQGLTAIRGNYAAGEHAYSISRVWNVEKLQTWSGTEALTTSTTSPVFGSSQNDVITGSTGDDVIDGLGGSDFIDGKAGTDTLVLFGVESQFAVQTIAGITHIKGLESSSEYAGHTITTINLETLAFTQNKTRPLETTSTNKIIGTDKADSINGSTGDDIIDGRGGNDQIDGGAGQDTLAIFGNSSDFNIAFPTLTNSKLTVTGKVGTEYASQTVTATNIESIAFIDRTVAVTNPPGVVLTPASTLIAEGGSTASLSVALTVAPNSDVTVSFNGGSQLTSSSAQLTFDPTNWSTPQTVVVSAIDDTIYEKQHTGTLTVSVQSSDSLYKSSASSTLTYTITDNDISNVGRVTGRLWNDLDQDKTLDSSESPLVGWTVFDDANKNGKLDAGEASAKTDVSGAYRLDDLAPGAHTIVAKTETGWTPTSPTTANASATIVTNTAGSGEVSVETLTETIVTQAVAQSTYANLGTATNIAAFHADSRFSDINGQGYSVVVIDTGIDLNHPYFGADSNKDGVADRIVYQYDFYESNDNNASDGQGHGTHVAGIIGSSDINYPGIAPGVNIIALKVFPDNEGGAPQTDIEQAVKWVVANVSKYNIVAINLSLGGAEFDQISRTSYLSDEFQALANNGVTVVSASGNGYKGTQGVSYPSSDYYSLSVGAVWGDLLTTSNPDYYFISSKQAGSIDAIAYFSQRDDQLSDIFAPGVYIGSANTDGTYIEHAGTSMASPEIAGMVALAQQLAVQELGHRLTLDQIRSLLKSTGDPIVDGDNENDAVVNTELTFYRVDMMAMAEAILAMKETPPVSYAVNVVAGATISDKDFGFASSQSVQALSSDDLIVGTTYGEIMRGGAGADQIQGGGGDDDIYGEEGDDILYGDAGDDYVDGGPGNDNIIGGSGEGDDTYVGGDGVDTVTYTSAISSIAVNLALGTASGIEIGNDTLISIENIVGGQADDSLTGDASDNVIEGYLGDDQIDGGAGTDTAKYQGTRADFTISRGGQSWFVTDNNATDGDEGADTLSSIEVLQFADQTIDLSVHVNAEPTGTITFTGSPTQGETLTASNTLVDADGLGTITYTWKAGTTTLGTGSTYTLTQAEVGKTITVTASYTDGFGTTEAVTSSATAAVSPPPLAAGTHQLSVIVDQGILATEAVILKGLSEVVAYTNGQISTHTVSYNGVLFDYSAVDALIITVARDSEFTDEFKSELTDLAPSASSLTYTDFAAVIGANKLDTVLIHVAGADGAYVDNNSTPGQSHEAESNAGSTHQLDVLVDRGVLGPDPVLLKGLTETIAYTGAQITTHTVEYAGIVFNYSDVDALITTVNRDGAFTEEFSSEIVDLAPSAASISYGDFVGLVGVTSLDSVLLHIAGADGNYVG